MQASSLPWNTKTSSSKRACTPSEKITPPQSYSVSHHHQRFQLPTRSPSQNKDKSPDPQPFCQSIANCNQEKEDANHDLIEEFTPPSSCIQKDPLMKTHSEILDSEQHRDNIVDFSQYAQIDTQKRFYENYTDHPESNDLVVNFDDYAQNQQANPELNSSFDRLSFEQYDNDNEEFNHEQDQERLNYYQQNLNTYTKEIDSSSDSDEVRSLDKSLSSNKEETLSAKQQQSSINQKHNSVLGKRQNTISNPWVKKKPLSSNSSICIPKLDGVSNSKIQTHLTQSSHGQKNKPDLLRKRSRPPVRHPPELTEDLVHQSQICDSHAPLLDISEKEQTLPPSITRRSQISVYEQHCGSCLSLKQIKSLGFTLLKSDTCKSKDEEVNQKETTISSKLIEIRKFKRTLSWTSDRPCLNTNTSTNTLRLIVLTVKPIYSSDSSKDGSIVGWDSLRGKSLYYFPKLSEILLLYGCNPNNAEMINFVWLNLTEVFKTNLIEFYKINQHHVDIRVESFIEYLYSDPKDHVMKSLFIQANRTKNKTAIICDRVWEYICTQTFLNIAEIISEIHSNAKNDFLQTNKDIQALLELQAKKKQKSSKSTLSAPVECTETSLTPINLPQNQPTSPVITPIQSSSSSSSKKDNQNPEQQQLISNLSNNLKWITTTWKLNQEENRRFDLSLLTPHIIKLCERYPEFEWFIKDHRHDFENSPELATFPRNRSCGYSHHDNSLGPCLLFFLLDKMILEEQQDE